MARTAFEAYVETQFPPPLQMGDVVILDNPPVQKSAHAADMLKSKRCLFLFLAENSHRVDMSFSTLKVHLRAASARIFDGPQEAMGDICGSCKKRMLELRQGRRIFVSLNARCSISLSD